MRTSGTTTSVPSVTSVTTRSIGGRAIGQNAPGGHVGPGAGDSTRTAVKGACLADKVLSATATAFTQTTSSAASGPQVTVNPGLVLGDGVALRAGLGDSTGDALGRLLGVIVGDGVGWEFAQAASNTARGRTSQARLITGCRRFAGRRSCVSASEAVPGATCSHSDVGRPAYPALIASLPMATRSSASTGHASRSRCPSSDSISASGPPR